MAGELPWRDLLKVDAGSWYSGEFKGELLPLLAEVADRCRQHGMMANIEIKPTTGTGPLTGKVIALAARELWEGMTAPLLSSFEIDALEAAQAAVPELPRVARGLARADGTLSVRFYPSQPQAAG